MYFFWVLMIVGFVIRYLIGFVVVVLEFGFWLMFFLFRKVLSF